MDAARLAEIRARLEAAKIQDGMRSGCGEYECDCHRDMPAILAHVERLEAVLGDLCQDREGAGFLAAKAMGRREAASLLRERARGADARNVLLGIRSALLKLADELEAMSREA